MRYVYLGDRATDPALVGMRCDPVLDARGKCVVGRGSALVVDTQGTQYVVIRRRLRIVRGEQLPLFDDASKPVYKDRWVK